MLSKQQFLLGEVFIMTQEMTVKVSTRYQISLPSRARQMLDIHAGDRLLVDIQGDMLILLPTPDDFVQALSGLGEDVWTAIDSATYLQQERDAWNRSNDA